MLVSDSTLQVPAGSRFVPRAAEHTPRSTGTNSRVNILKKLHSIRICFTLHHQSAYHVKIWGFISHENVPYIFMLSAIKHNERGTPHRAPTLPRRYRIQLIQGQRVRFYLFESGINLALKIIYVIIALDSGCYVPVL